MPLHFHRYVALLERNHPDSVNATAWFMSVVSKGSLKHDGLADKIDDEIQH